MESDELITKDPLDFLNAPSSDDEEAFFGAPPEKRTKYDFVIGGGNSTRKPAVKEDHPHSLRQHIARMDDMFAKVGDDINDSKREPLLCDRIRAFSDEIEREIRKNKYFPFWNSYVGGFEHVNVSAILQPLDYEQRGLSAQDVLKRIDALRKATSEADGRVDGIQNRVNAFVAQLRELSNRAVSIETSFDAAELTIIALKQAKRFLLVQAILALRDYLKDWMQLDMKPFMNVYHYLITAQDSAFDTQLEEYVTGGKNTYDADRIMFNYVAVFLFSNLSAATSTDINRPLPDYAVDVKRLDADTLSHEGAQLDQKGVVDILAKMLDKRLARFDAAAYESSIRRSMEHALREMQPFLSGEPFVFSENAVDDVLSFLELGKEWLELRRGVVVAQQSEFSNLENVHDELVRIREGLGAAVGQLREFEDLKQPLEMLHSTDEPLHVFPEHERAVDDALMYVRNSIPGMRNASRDALMLNSETRVAFAGLALYNHVKGITVRYPRSWRPVRTIDDLRQDATRFITELARVGSREKTIRVVNK